MKQVLLFLIAVLFCLGHGYAQQRAMFTQYMFNGLAINPAYSAIDEALNVTTLARQQWTGFKGAPNTQTFSIHTPIKETNTSIGLMLMRDQIGEVITENGAFLTLAQRVQLNETTYMAVGLNGGLNKYVANFSRISSQTSGTDPVFNNQNDLHGNFGFGLMLFSNKFYAGFSSPFFFYHDLGDASKSGRVSKPHYMIQGGYLANLGESLKFKPNLLIKYVNGSPVQIDLNANFLIKEVLWLGASLRSLDSFDALMQIQLTPHVQLGYSYDFTTTELSKVESGSHEIMLNFRIPVKGRGFPRCYF